MGKLILFILSGFYLGCSPIVPGTCGTLLGIPFYMFFSDITRFITALVLFIIGVVLSNKMVKETGQKDPSFIVIDEIVGFIVATLFIEFTVINVIIIFVLFRFFDIVKPWPVNKLEKLKDGWGIMADDVMAGIYANIVLRIVLNVI